MNVFYWGEVGSKAVWIESNKITKTTNSWQNQCEIVLMSYLVGLVLKYSKYTLNKIILYKPDLYTF